jgi:membrane protease YdiL (CAAX protease family)
MCAIHRVPRRRRAIVEAVLVLYIYYALLMIFIIAPPLICNAIGLEIGLRPGAAITLFCVVIAESIALLAAVKFYKRLGVTLRDAGWGAPSSRPIIAFSLAAAFGYIGYAALIPEIGANITEISLFKIWGVVVGVSAAIVEEIVFRGFLMARFEQARIRPIIQVCLTAVAFGLLHLGFGLWGVVCTFTLGIVLGVLYVFGKRSLTGPIVCHGVINAAIEPWLLLWLLKFYAEKYG